MDEKSPESSDELEPVSLRELEMILKPGKPPPPIKKAEPPRPPRPPVKNAARTQGDLGVGDLAAFAVLSGSTPPPAPVQPAAPSKDETPEPPKPAVKAALPPAVSLSRKGEPRAQRPLPKAPTKKDPKHEPPRPADSALEDLKALARASARPKMDSVDFDEILAMKDDESARALSAPTLPLDLTLLTSTPDPVKAPEAADGWEDPPAPPAALPVADERDAEPPASRPPPSSRAPSSRRAIGRDGRGASSRPPKSQRGARTASKAPPATKKVETPAAAVSEAPKRAPSIAPAKAGASSVAPQSLPPEAMKGRSRLPVFLGVGAVALAAAVIYLATRGPSEPTAQNAASSDTERTAAPGRTATPPSTPGQIDATPTAALVANRSGPTDPVSTGPTTPINRPPDPVGNPQVPTSTPPTETTPTPTPTSAPTSAPTSTPTATASAQPAGEFNASAASAALSGRLGAAAGCKQPGDPSGVARVTVTFAPSGRVTQANVNGPPFAGTKTGGCIAGAMRGATIPPFTGSAQTVSKTVNIP